MWRRRSSKDTEKRIYRYEWQITAIGRVKSMPRRRLYFVCVESCPHCESARERGKRTSWVSFPFLFALMELIIITVALRLLRDVWPGSDLQHLTPHNVWQACSVVLPFCGGPHSGKTESIDFEIGPQRQSTLSTAPPTHLDFCQCRVKTRRKWIFLRLQAFPPWFLCLRIRPIREEFLVKQESGIIY